MSFTCGPHGWRHQLKPCPYCNPEQTSAASAGGDSIMLTESWNKRTGEHGQYVNLSEYVKLQQENEELKALLFKWVDTQPSFELWDASKKAIGYKED